MMTDRDRSVGLLYCRNGSETGPERSHPVPPGPGLQVHNRFRRAYLIHLSSELRNPLNAVAGYCQLLLEDTIDLGRHDIISKLHRIQKANDRLLSDIDDLLKPLKLEETCIHTDPGIFGTDLRHCLRHTSETLCLMVDQLQTDSTNGHQGFLSADIEKIDLAIKDFKAVVENLTDLSNSPAEISGLVSDTYSILSDSRHLPVHGDGVTSGMQKTVSADNASVLIVDDHPLNRDLLSRLIKRQGHVVQTAENGAKALEMAKSHAFDLILLDVIMPAMSGIQVLKRLKADPALQSVPVLMISAVDEKDTVIRCIEWGADDYLIKPFNPVLLRARMNVSIEKKRLRDRERLYLQKIETELSIARKIQKHFLPARLPEPAGWEIAALLQPARQVAGDFYDVFPVPGGNRLGIVIGDVCGKGVSAALFMGLFRSFIRIFADLFYSNESILWSLPGSTAANRPDVENISTLSVIVELLNNFIANHHGKANMFATLFFGILEPSSGTLMYVNGGNEPPVILNPNHQTQLLSATGPMVGMLPDMAFKARQINIAQGETFIAFTDGITEAKDPLGNELRDGHLMKMLAAPVGSAAGLIDRFKTFFRDSATEADQFDDRTMLVVRRTAF
jgi:serine phosphatase RsbU (regulator of sigma subunit)